jgi:uncharacterized protein (DUF488 family)
MINSKLYSIGYGNRSMKQFIEILQKNDIQLLVDVRTNPVSRFKPEFNSKAFQVTLSEYGIQYINKVELGGKPKSEEFYQNGKLDYDKLRKSIPYLKGIEYLERGLEFGYRMAVMCSELDFNNCHRNNLIGEDMNRRGWEVIHINKQGEPQLHQTGLF